MTDQITGTGEGSPFPGRRRAASGDAASLVRSEPLVSGSRAILLTATTPGLDPVSWAGAARAMLERSLEDHGAVLLRGFQPLDPKTFEAFAAAISEKLLEYDNRSTPRSRVVGRVFTSTEYPASLTIPLHNEMSYTDVWPRRIIFTCVTPSRTGGETPIADSAAIYQRIPPEIRKRFEAHGIMYVRNFGLGIDLTWQEAFQTEDPSEVEAYCRAHDIRCEWLPAGRLRTRQTAQATAPHPVTGNPVWFNQAHLFHASSLPEDVGAALREIFAEDELPRNALLGDGRPIPLEDLAEIRAALEAEEIATPWQAGDIMLLDNIQFAHGRRPFEGERRVLVAMT